MKRSSIISVDIGGTKIAAARYDPNCLEIEAQERIETHADQSFSRVLEDMVRLILSLKTEDTTAFGVGSWTRGTTRRDRSPLSEYSGKRQDF